MGLDQLLSDGQPQPRLPVGPRAGLVATPEALEDIGQICRGDARPRVGHPDLHSAVHPPDGHGDPTSSRGVAQSVDQQIAQHLLQPVGIRLHGRQSGGQVRDQFDPLLRRLGTEVACGPLDQLLHLGRLFLDGQLPRLNQGQFPQIFHQTGEEHTLLVDGGDILGRGREDAIQQSLQVALNDAERGAQLVGDVGHHVAAQLLRPGQALGHGVEGMPHLPEFVLRPHLDPLAQVADGDPPGSGRQSAQRGSDLKEEERAHDQGDDPGSQPRQQKGAVDRTQELALQSRLPAGLDGGGDEGAHLLPVHHDGHPILPFRLGQFLPHQLSARISHHSARRIGQDQAVAHDSLHDPDAPACQPPRPHGRRPHHGHTPRRLQQALHVLPASCLSVVVGQERGQAQGVQLASFADVEVEMVGRDPVGQEVSGDHGDQDHQGKSAHQPEEEAIPH